jgi:hypothetical protein
VDCRNRARGLGGWQATRRHVASSHDQPSPSSAGSYRAPALEHALVEDALRPGIISCGPETDLTTVARTMATNHVHAVVVSGTEIASFGGEQLSWGIVTALDLVGAALPGLGAWTRARWRAPRSSPSISTSRWSALRN